jgi:OOP family OmpA-OmpF porin
MNYSTLKKTVVFSFASLMVVGIANAQTDSTKATATTTMKDTTMKSSSGTGTPKIFGGLGQYSTFSLGVNAGITSPFLETRGSNATTNWKGEFGYGLSLRQQLSHGFGLQLDFHGGKVSGDNDGGVSNGGTSFSTKFYDGTLNGVINIGSVSFMHRKNSVNFFGLAGAGLASYHPTFVDANGNAQSYTETDGSDHWVKEFLIDLGAGVKFRLGENVALNLGYTENFVDGNNFSGYKTNGSSHFGYGYGGLEFTFGPSTKPNLDWVNPVAVMYDELYDAALRQEVEALKGRVGNVETAVNDLKKDSDGDGVSDQFDKCANTPAGTVVDGSGCPIVFPKADTVAMAKAAAAPYTNIQFEFDSSVLRTSAYPTLDATSADLRSMSGKKIELDGFASSEGTAAHNMRLSKDRANSVKTYLVNSGVDAKRVTVKGYGETHPIADNSTEDGRILNRRVEFKQK